VNPCAMYHPFAMYPTFMPGAGLEDESAEVETRGRISLSY